MIRAVALEPTLPGVSAHPCEAKRCHQPAAWRVVIRTRGRGSAGEPTWRAKALEVCDSCRRDLSARIRIGAIA